MVTYYQPDMSGLEKEVKKMSNGEMISDLEIKIIERLYDKYKVSKKLYCWKILDAYKELGVSEGDYVGMLNDSKYIEIDIDCLKITNMGIRFMDSQEERKHNNREEIIRLNPEFHGIGVNLKVLFRKIKNWFKK